ncbi:stress response protein nst1-like [Colletes gigas]|uniref:stress response protein nst1-like n=1 Tax=Colletes gigas TaxID=935657 RepID=UPI001C9BACB6|nr:stress response protein nst1-like [Colletes gigas]
MFNKKKYRIELSQVQNIRPDKVRNAGDLVNFIIGENQELLDHEEQGSLVVSKIESSKKGEQILFAQRLELPMTAKTNFDALLEPFYTRKPLDFDESILEIQDERSQVIKDTLSKSRQNEISYAIIPQNSNKREENDDDYAPAPQLDLSDDKEEDESDSGRDKQVINDDPSEPSNDTGRTEINVPASTLLTEDAIKEIVAKEMKDKDEEIERLKQSLRSQEKEEIAKVENPPVKDDHVSEAILATPLVSSDSSEDVNVLDVIKMVKYDANKRLEDFIDQETAKINAEIEALDTRDKIEPTLSKRFGDEKEFEIKELNRKVESEKTEAITTEKARHEAALKSIESESEANRVSQLAKLTEEFSTKLSSAIKEEYERQTEQLNLILQGKTEELQLRQKAVNEGMKNTVSEVLEGFNTNHGEVIQNVERRKNSSGVISLHHRVG